MNQDPLLQHLLSLQPQMQALAEHLLGNAAEAEDIVQEVVVSIWQRHNDTMNVDNINGYVMNAIRNRCINCLRRRHSFVNIDDLSNYSDDDACRDAALIEERAAKLDTMLKKLPDNQRKAIQMKYIEGLSHQEMQRRLGMSSSNVYTTLSRAISALKTMSHER